MTNVFLSRGPKTKAARKKKHEQTHTKSYANILGRQAAGMLLCDLMQLVFWDSFRLFIGAQSSHNVSSPHWNKKNSKS